MAKKTTTIVEEEVTPEVNPKVEEHDKAVLEALNKDDALTIEPDKLDEPAKEEPKTEEKTEEKKEEEPVIDKEAIKAEITEEVKKELVSKIQGTKEEQKDAYAEFEKTLWDKEKRTPTYKEALDFIKTQAKDEIKAELDAEIAEENKQKEEAKKTEAAQQQELNDNLNKEWDEQIDDLVKAGRIPAIKDPNNNQVQIIRNTEGKEIERIPVEPGKRARYDLFKAMYVASEERIQNGAKPLTNLKEIFYEHYDPKKQPAGANAPIAGVRKSVSQDSGNSFKYSEIHNTSMENLLNQG